MKSLAEMDVCVWDGNELKVLNQLCLPNEQVWLSLRTYQEVAEAIKSMQIRGAPLIGIVAAYGMALAGYEFNGKNFKDFMQYLEGVAEYLLATRPTAVNLSWAVRRMLSVATAATDVTSAKLALIEEAKTIEAQQKEADLRLADWGNELIKAGMRILTICNTGTLATGGIGTALGIIFRAKQLNKDIEVYICETRPLLQGARLTTYELTSYDVAGTLICDSLVPTLMRKGMVDVVITGADRIARNGDVANKVGTYMLACCAKLHGIPFYVAAPTSTIDPNVPTGEQIPIEERSPTEITELFFKKNIASNGIKVYNPAFDITPHQYICAIITEKGIFYPPYNFDLNLA